MKLLLFTCSLYAIQYVFIKVRGRGRGEFGTSLIINEMLYASELYHLKIFVQIPINIIFKKTVRES